MIKSKIFIEISTSDSPQTALARVSKNLQSLAGYKIDSIKSNPANNLLRIDSKDNLKDSSDLSSDLNSDFNDLSNPSHIQKAIKENRRSELETNNNKRLDTIQKEQETKEFLAEKAVSDSREEQMRRIVEANSKR